MVYKIPPGNPTVVWDTLNGVITHDPYVSWTNHIARTDSTRGGVDMTTGGAIPVYAPMDCTVYRYAYGAGIAVRMWALDGSGWSDIFDHLTSVDVADGTTVPFGGRVATSGNTGTQAQHLHWHRLDPQGVRQIPWDYFNDATLTTRNIDEEENMLYVLHVWDSAQTPADRWAITGPGYWSVLTGNQTDHYVKPGLTSRFGTPIDCLWGDWDQAYRVAVATGYVPASGQTSRTIT